MEMAGIYMIRNKVNEKKYIGRTKSLSRRWAVHKCDLKKGKHVNKHLQASVNKYGIDAFEYSIVEELFPTKSINKRERTLLKDKELYWANYYNVFDTDKGYNLYPIIEGGKMNPVTREKLSNAHRGERNSNATITDSEAIRICNRINSGYKLRDIAREFGVTLVTVKKIYHGVTWKHIGEEYLTPSKRVNKTIPKECILDIYEHSINGVADNYNAAVHNVSRFVVHQIRTGKTHRKLIEKYFSNVNSSNPEISS